MYIYQGVPCDSDSKESACNAGDSGSIPGSGRSPGEGNGNPLQYSFLVNSMDRGAWRATVHGVAKSQTRLSDSHTQIFTKTPCITVAVISTDDYKQEQLSPMEGGCPPLPPGLLHTRFTGTWSCKSTSGCWNVSGSEVPTSRESERHCAFSTFSSRLHQLEAPLRSWETH